MGKNANKIHEGYAFNRDYIAMTMPLFLMAFFYNGPRVLLMAGAAVLTAKITDRLASLMRGRRHDRTENSSTVIALVIVLMMPVTAQYRVVVAAVVVAVLVGKEVFGGYQSYPFNPAAVGFCAVAISWPNQVMRYPQPLNWLFKPMPQTLQAAWSMWNFEGVSLSSGPSAALSGGSLPSQDIWDLLLGNYPGPMGVTCTLVIASCAVYLVVKKRMPLSAPLAFMGMVVLVAFLFPRYNDIGWHTFPYDIVQRLLQVMYEALTGALVFAAVFLVPEAGTLPKNRVSRIIYGALLGFASMMFRYFGTYELGVCFAFLLVNAVSGYFDRAIARRSAARKEAALQ